MLIVNADDLGRRRDDTDSALACHARGCIDSASAMVHMADSERAAERARAADLPVALHRNLSELFTADANPHLRASQERVRRFLRSYKYALLLYHRFLAADFAQVCEAQFAELRRLYGRDPAHVNGNQHVRLCTHVLMQRRLPEGARVRRRFPFAPGQKSLLNRWYRTRVDRTLARRHRPTDRFLSLSEQLNSARLDPAWRHEHDYLIGDALAALLRTLQAAAPAAT